MTLRTLMGWLASFAAVGTLSACASLGYYRQAVAGHLQILRRAVPIETAIRDPNTSPALRTRLELVQDIRRFAIQSLHLPDNGSYQNYADLKRPYALWNVFATPEFSLKAIESCFPFVGCLDYRGYYSERDAQDYARQLHARGDDVYVAGIAAYSTLGWLSDPVLNTMLRWSESEQAGIIFHELAHQKLYVRGDSAFNESFASAVEEEGVRRWLVHTQRPALSEALLIVRRRREAFVDLVEKTRQRLEGLYAAKRSVVEMRRGKAAIFAGMRADYARLRESWGGYSGYDEWFDGELNNARLMAVTTYQAWVPAFRRLLAYDDGNLDRFYAHCRDASRLPPVERDRWLAGWRDADIGGY